MSKFLLFAGHNYYPEGGMADLECVADTADECLAQLTTYPSTIDKGPQWTLRRITRPGYGQGSEVNWWHIVDIATMTIVACDSDSAAELRGETEWGRYEEDGDVTDPDTFGRLPGLYRANLKGWLTLAESAIVLSLSAADREALESYHKKPQQAP